MRDHRTERHRLDWPPAPVREVSGMFLALADEAAPGLVVGLYLHGSLGFGEWYDGRSDVDYVAVLAKRPDAEAVDALGRVHSRVAEAIPRPAFDGHHVTWADLAAPPDSCPDVPCTFAGSFAEEGRVDLHPVTWHELARHGVTVRGPRAEDLDIWTDDAALRRYTHGNLASYWAGEVAALRRFPDEAATPDAVAWYVLGTARLHHLLATGRLTSKSGAGRYAATAFGERWGPLAEVALAVRERGLLAEYDGALGQDVVAFADLVVRSGLALGA